DVSAELRAAFTIAQPKEDVLRITPVDFVIAETFRDPLLNLFVTMDQTGHHVMVISVRIILVAERSFTSTRQVHHCGEVCRPAWLLLRIVIAAPDCSFFG